MYNQDTSEQHTYESILQASAITGVLASRICLVGGYANTVDSPLLGAKVQFG